MSCLLLCGTCFLVPCYAVADSFSAMKIKPFSDIKTPALNFTLKYLDGTLQACRISAEKWYYLILGNLVPAMYSGNARYGETLAAI